MKNWKEKVMQLHALKMKLHISNYRLAKEIKVSESTIKRTFDLATIPKLDLIYKIENHLQSAKKK